MIGYLKGTIQSFSLTSLIILVNGVGYEVLTPTLFLEDKRTDDEVEVYIYTHVREDQLALYGFKDKEELSFFKMLLSVSGIGPKVALAIVSSASVEKLAESISAGDPGMLSAVSGVGKKTAEKAVIELKGKLGFISEGSILASGETEEIYSALMGLGFRKEEISESIRNIPSDIMATDDKIKALIKIIGTHPTGSGQGIK